MQPGTKRSFGLPPTLCRYTGTVNPSWHCETPVNGGDKITIELVPDATEEVSALVGELDRILSAEYLPEQRHGLALDAIFKPDIRFFLARSNGLAVGCGGVAFFADFAEVKRMYVRDAARGRGVAQALLARIESETSEAGFAVLRIETGVRQIAALRFYQRAGFRPCAAFGAYATMAPQAVATSVFLEKRLRE
jgi:putative acetyltransferase